MNDNERKYARAVAKRYMTLPRGISGFRDQVDTLDVYLYLEAMNRIVPLDLALLLTSRQEDLVHDVSGMIQRIDRETGMSKDPSWRPRYAKRGD